MTKQEKAKALRSDQKVHYNCAQSVLIPFADECGVSEETAGCLGANFGSGMRMGSVCGAVTGALMALGAMGCGEEESRKLLREFREKNGCLDCVDLLRQAHERGEERKCHCDRMVADCVALVEKLTGTCDEEK